MLLAQREILSLVRLPVPPLQLHRDSNSGSARLARCLASLFYYETYILECTHCTLWHRLHVSRRPGRRADARGKQAGGAKSRRGGPGGKRAAVRRTR